MTWIDDKGEVRPQSWEEYLTMKNSAESETCDCAICQRIRKRESTYKLRRARYNAERVERGRTPKPDPLPRMRIRLFRADPHCFWCGIEVVLDGHKKPTLATVDHLYSRWHPERKTRHSQGDGVLHVLACANCNSERAAAENQLQPFIPKLPERLQFAQLADATLARNSIPPLVSREVAATKTNRAPITTRRVICTLKEAMEFAKGNPAR